VGRQLAAWITVALSAALLVAACGGDSETSTPSAANGVEETVRQALAEGTTETAPDQLLELTRVVIPAETTLTPHNHPGPQLAFIEFGELTYTVIDGEATVRRAVATEGETTETYASGQSLVLGEGDSIMEPTGMVHMAENKTGEPIVIYLSSLFPEGEPAASLVE
jgi:quercetin dioxygenase-like cupin family protein